MALNKTGETFIDATPRENEAVRLLFSRTSTAYSSGVLADAFFGGAAYAAFSAVVLFAIGRGAASTKYAALSSLRNVPVVT